MTQGPIQRFSRAMVLLFLAACSRGPEVDELIAAAEGLTPSPNVGTKKETPH